MEIKSFSNYQGIYESKINEVIFFKENNVTANDILLPLEDLLTEEFIGKMLSKGADWVKKKGQQIGKFAKDTYQKVKTAVVNAFKSVVDFFKDFSFKKLKDAVVNTVRNIGNKVFGKLKEYLGVFSEFIIENNLCDENNRPNFKNIWGLIVNKAKGTDEYQNAEIKEEDLEKAVAPVAGKMNEAKDFTDEEVKYLSFWQTLAYKLGIKNPRFNGVVSEIAKKGTIGVIIFKVLSLAGISFGFLGALSPVAMAVLGGMLLMAGIIILSIWIVKPYPDIEDCLAYLEMYYGSESGEEDTAEEDTAEEEIEVLDKKKLYPTMIKNLKALQSLLISSEGVSLEDERGGSKSKGLVVGKEYTYTNKSGKKRKVRLLSKDSSLRMGKDKKYLTGDDVKTDTLNKGDVFVQFANSKGKYPNNAPSQAVSSDTLSPISESNDVLLFTLFEKKFGKDPRKVDVTSAEDYLSQAVTNIRKSVKMLKNEKDKGIAVDSDFIDEILSEKMNSDTKKPVTDLYNDIFSYLYGKNSKTMSDFGPLYKESVDVISNKSKRQVVAEKIARFSKRSLQFEGEGFYSGLGEFGEDIKEFNSTLNQIMDYFKEETNESVIRFGEYIK